MYKVYERLEVQGIKAFNTLIGTFKFSRDAELFRDAKTKKEAYDKLQSRKSFFIFEETDTD